MSSRHWPYARLGVTDVRNLQCFVQQYIVGIEVDKATMTKAHPQIFVLVFLLEG